MEMIAIQNNNQMSGAEGTKVCLGQGSRKKKYCAAHLYKQKPCLNFAQGFCQFGSKCTFIHSANEMKSAPSSQKPQLPKKQHQDQRKGSDVSAATQSGQVAQDIAKLASSTSTWWVQQAVRRSSVLHVS
jgi:hypothetical protein